MKTALIISLNFNPGHVSHLRACYKQLKECGYHSVYYVNEDFVGFLPRDSRVCIYEQCKVEKGDVAIFLFPSLKNILLIRSLKQQGTEIIYIFHEPLAPMKVYRKAGFSYKYLAKLWLINRINALTVKWSDVVLLPSKKAVELYNDNPLYNNMNAHYLPLLYDDERSLDHPKNREYFGYIGTVAADHSFYEFLKFVEWAIKKNRLPQLKFLIATKSEFEVPQALTDSSRVVLQKGRPLSDEEINEYYASTYIVWNAYARTTQSGVLAKSFMFGTPAIVLRKNLSEFTEDGKEVVAIDDNTSFEQIEEAVIKIMETFPDFSNAARKRFENTFYYKKYNEQMKSLIY